MASVRFEGVTKRFGEVVALDALTLTIEDGEFMVFVGPSGCGKTTALRLVAGLESATEGTIRIGEQVMNDVPPKDRDVAMVFQTYALYPHMTVFENMAFGLRLRNRRGWVRRLVRRSEAQAIERAIDEKVRETARMLGIETLLHRRPKELSGGQRQRVALGRAIVREPRVFLMDEPLSNLDAKLRVQTRAELIRLHRQLGITTLYVTHDQTEAMTMGDRIAVMNEGRLQQVGPPLELYQNPANTFVASFLGSPAMNLLEVRVRDGVVELGGARIPFPHDREHAILGFRPESVRPGPGEYTIQATVDVVEPLGSVQTVLLRVGEHEITALLPASEPMMEGAPVTVSLEGPSLHWFSVETGEALR
ncbi:MAG: ABC transporter ATP-binding protein [Armatimonadetes bacterium]|nr:MAG: ABC transporter ATP-binding protein [Armatimonadota bacterium]